MQLSRALCPASLNSDKSDSLFNCLCICIFRKLVISLSQCIFSIVPILPAPVLAPGRVARHANQFATRRKKLSLGPLNALPLRSFAARAARQRLAGHRG